MSLKLRLNLIITGLLLFIMLAGTALTLSNARQNVRAEVASAEKLALYLFDSPSDEHVHVAPLVSSDASGAAVFGRF